MHLDGFASLECREDAIGERVRIATFTHHVRQAHDTKQSCVLRNKSFDVQFVQDVRQLGQTLVKDADCTEIHKNSAVVQALLQQIHFPFKLDCRIEGGI